MEKNARFLFEFPPLPNGWIWNGYYSRELNSPFLNFFGKVAIRVAYDEENNCHHAYIPAFITPYLHITIYDLKIIIEAFLKSLSVQETLDEYSSIGSKEYYDLSSSSIYYLLKWFIRKVHIWLEVQVSSNSISNFKNFPKDIFLKLTNYLHARASPT